MLLLALALTAASPAAEMPVINPKANQPEGCPATSRYEVSHRGKTPKAQRLNELPDALKDADQAVKLDPQEPEAYITRAEIKESLGAPSSQILPDYKAASALATLCRPGTCSFTCATASLSRALT